MSIESLQSRIGKKKYLLSRLDTRWDNFNRRYEGKTNKDGNLNKRLQRKLGYILADIAEHEFHIYRLSNDLELLTALNDYNQAATFSGYVRDLRGLLSANEITNFIDRVQLVANDYDEKVETLEQAVQICLDDDQASWILATTIEVE